MYTNFECKLKKPQIPCENDQILIILFLFVSFNFGFIATKYVIVAGEARTFVQNTSHR